MWKGPPITANGSHPCKSLSWQHRNGLLSIQLFSVAHVGGEKRGSNDLAKTLLQAALSSLAPPTAVIPHLHFVTAVKGWDDLMLVATVCHCNGTDLWTSHPLLPSRITMGQSQIYSGCRELLALCLCGRRCCRDVYHPPAPKKKRYLSPCLSLHRFLRNKSLWLKFACA